MRRILLLALLCVLASLAARAQTQHDRINSKGIIDTGRIDVNLNLLLGRNLVPDSVVSLGQSKSTPYWKLFYGTGISTGWGVSIGGGTSGNAITFTGTGSAIPRGTDYESSAIPLPVLSAGNYTLTLSASVDATNVTAGTLGVYACALTSSGTIGTCDVVASQAAGVSGVISLSNSAIPGNVGYMVFLLVASPSGTTVISNGNRVSFSNFQLEIGSALTAYQPSQGYAGRTLAFASHDFWPVIVNGFLPETAMGTLATSQTPVTLGASATPILNSVSSAPTFNFGKGETLPGFATTTAYSLKGIAVVSCNNVTVAGTVTVVFSTISASSGGVYSDFTNNDGVGSLTLPVPTTAGTEIIVFPLQIAITGNPINSDYGLFDFRALETGVTGTCRVTQAALEATVYPTDSTVAGTNVIKGSADKSHLLY